VGKKDERTLAHSILSQEEGRGVNTKVSPVGLLLPFPILGLDYTPNQEFVKGENTPAGILVGYDQPVFTPSQRVSGKLKCLA